MKKKNPRESYNACFSLMKHYRTVFGRCRYIGDELNAIISRKNFMDILATAKIIRCNAEVEV